MREYLKEYVKTVNEKRRLLGLFESNKAFMRNDMGAEYELFSSCYIKVNEMDKDGMVLNHRELSGEAEYSSLQIMPAFGFYYGNMQTTDSLRVDYLRINDFPVSEHRRSMDLGNLMAYNMYVDAGLEQITNKDNSLSGIKHLELCKTFEPMNIVYVDISSLVIEEIYFNDNVSTVTTHCDEDGKPMGIIKNLDLWRIIRAKLGDGNVTGLVTFGKYWAYPGFAPKAKRVLNLDEFFKFHIDELVRENNNELDSLTDIDVKVVRG